MRLRLVPAAALVAALGWAASSPSLPAPAPNPTPAPAAEFEARMGDDSVVKVTLAEPVLVVATKYGRLTVPAADVRKVELGFRYPEGAEAKIDRAVQDLGSPSFETREAAEKTLVGLDHLAVPAARRATHSPDPEGARRAAQPRGAGRGGPPAGRSGDACPAGRRHPGPVDRAGRPERGPVRGRVVVQGQGGRVRQAAVAGRFEPVPAGADRRLQGEGDRRRPVTGRGERGVPRPASLRSSGSREGRHQQAPEFTSDASDRSA